MNKDVLTHIFKEAIRRGLGVKVDIRIPNLPGLEVIINPPENVEEKLQYYLAAYNEDLTHKMDPGVVIVAVSTVGVKD